MEALANTLNILLEALLPIALLVIVPLLTQAILKWTKKLGLDAEALNRDALQTAITNAALEAARRAGGPGRALTATAIQAGLDQVKGAVPDAIEKFQVSDASLRARVAAQAIAVVNVPAAAGAVAPTPEQMIDDRLRALLGPVAPTPGSTP